MDCAAGHHVHGFSVWPVSPKALDSRSWYGICEPQVNQGLEAMEAVAKVR